MAKSRRDPSWGAIILGFIFFWPLGLFLMIKRLMNDKAAAVRKDKVAPAMGWLLLFMGLCILFPQIRIGRILTIISLFGAFILIGGLIALKKGRQNNQEGSHFRLYIDAIVNQGMTSFRDIGAYTGVHEAQVRKEIKKMIKMGYFEQAYIDEYRGEIHILRHHEAESIRQARRQDPQGASVGAEQAGLGQAVSGQAVSGTVETMTTCRNCGAHNWVLPGVRNSCEFCGSPIGS